MLAVSLMHFSDAYGFLHDAYAKGDRVTDNGKVWESTIDGNVWAPGVSGWREVTV